MKQPETLAARAERLGRVARTWSIQPTPTGLAAELAEILALVSDPELSATLASAESLRTGAALCAEMLGMALDQHPRGHYAHHDPEGKAGAACPACHADARTRHLTKAARDALL